MLKFFLFGGTLLFFLPNFLAQGEVSGTSLESVRLVLRAGIKQGTTLLFNENGIVCYQVILNECLNFFFVGIRHWLATHTDRLFHKANEILFHRFGDMVFRRFARCILLHFSKNGSGQHEGGILLKAFRLFLPSTFQVVGELLDSLRQFLLLGDFLRNFLKILQLIFVLLYLLVGSVDLLLILAQQGFLLSDFLVGFHFLLQNILILVLGLNPSISVFLEFLFQQAEIFYCVINFLNTKDTGNGVFILASAGRTIIVDFFAVKEEVL